MIGKKIVGLYLTKEFLDYACASKGIFGLSPWSMRHGDEPYGRLHGPELSTLKEFLGKIPPESSPDIYLALPRGLFFIRDLQLPPMLLEEAFASIKSNLSLYSHLPEEDIYYDVHFCSGYKQGVKALLIYAPSKEINRILEVFEETGTRRLLRGLFPLSYGVFKWLVEDRGKLSLALQLPDQDGMQEVVVYEQGCFAYSGAVLKGEETEGIEQLVIAAKAKHQEVVKQIFSLNPGVGPELPGKSKGVFKKFPPLEQNMALAGLAAGIGGSQVICLDGTHAKIKRFRPAVVLVPLVLAFFCIMFLATWSVKKEIEVKQQQVNVLAEEMEVLKKKVDPLRREVEILSRTTTFVKDIKEYLASRPKLYSLINEIATLTPPGTWFSSFVYEKDTITLSGQSDDALKVVEALRKSKSFSQVKLVGSVNRIGGNKERFKIKIKKLEGEEEQGARKAKSKE